MADKGVFGFFCIFISPHVSTYNKFTYSPGDHRVFPQTCRMHVKTAALQMKTDQICLLLGIN